MEEFLTASGLEEDLWLIRYLSLALECDVPILEAYWHNCYKEICVKWDESTQSYRNESLQQLLIQFFITRIVHAFPSWLTATYGKRWACIALPTYQQLYANFFEVIASRRGEESVNIIKVAACTRPVQADPTTQHASFAVQWESNQSRLGVSIDDKEWETVEAGEFLPLLESQITRLIKIFHV